MISKLGTDSLDTAIDPGQKDKKSLQVNSNLDLCVNLNEASYKKLEVIYQNKEQTNTITLDTNMVIDEADKQKVNSFLSVLASKT